MLKTLGTTTRVNIDSTPRRCSSYTFWSVPANQAGSGSTWSNDPSRRNTPLQLLLTPLIVCYNFLNYYICMTFFYYTHLLFLYQCNFIYVFFVELIFIILVSLRLIAHLKLFPSIWQRIPTRPTRTHTIATEIYYSVWCTMLG